MGINANGNVKWVGLGAWAGLGLAKEFGGCSSKMGWQKLVADFKLRKKRNQQRKQIFTLTKINLCNNLITNIGDNVMIKLT